MFFEPKTPCYSVVSILLGQPQLFLFQFFRSRVASIVFVLFIKAGWADCIPGFFPDKYTAAGAAVFRFPLRVTVSSDFLNTFGNFPVVIPVVLTAVVTGNIFTGFFDFTPASRA